MEQESGDVTGGDFRIFLNLNGFLITKERIIGVTLLVGANKWYSVRRAVWLGKNRWNWRVVMLRAGIFKFFEFERILYYQGTYYGYYACNGN